MLFSTSGWCVLNYNLRENDVSKNMAKWTKMMDTQITIPQNIYASINMMAKLINYSWPN